MPNKDGIITRKDIITDDALQFGEEYSKQTKIALDANKILVSNVKELNTQVLNFKVANSQKDYLTIKQATTLATQKAIGAIKEQEAAEISANKIRISNIAAMEAERKMRVAVTDAENKNITVKQKSTKLTAEERVQNEVNNKILKQEARELLGLVTAYEKLNNKRTEAKNKLRDLIASETASTAEIKKAQKEFDVLAVKVKRADDAVNDFTKNVGNYPLGNVASGLKNLIGAFGVTGGITAFASIMKGAYQTIKQFEQGLADLSAITGASGKDLDYLKNRAIDLGKSTKGGAIAVVEAYKLIGSAKPELLEDVKALNAVTEATLTLAKAAGMELPDAATALTDAMNQFGADASQAGEFIDALANGAKFGAAEIPQITEALLKFGAVARSSNISIQESTALIELLAENGIKGADAGTALRNVLLKISAPDALPKEAQKALKELGISFEMLKDKAVPIQEKFEALKPLLADNGKLLKAFGFENTVAARNIIEHTDRLKVLTDSMNQFGTAEEQAAIRSNTLQGKTDRLASTYDSLILSLSSGSGVVSKFFTYFVDGAKNALDGLIRLNTSWDELFKKSEAEGATIGTKMFDQFSRGLEPEKVVEKFEKFRATFFKSRNSLEQELAKNEEELAKRSSLRLSNPFGKSIKDYKKDIERLKGELAQLSAFSKAYQELLNKNQKKSSDTEEAPTVDSGESEADRKKRLDAAKKAALARLEIEKNLANSLYELQKQRLEQLIKFNDEIVADDQETDEVRIQALYNSQQKQEDLLLLTKNHLLEIEKLSYQKEVEENKGNKANLKLLEENHANNKLRINEDYSNKVIEVNEKTKKAFDKINEFDEASYAKILEDRVSRLNVQLNAELQLENERFNALSDLDQKREKNIQDHEQRLFDIRKKYSIDTLKLQITNLESELAASDALPPKEQLSADKRQKIAETLSKAKLDLSEVELSDNEKKNEKHEESERKTAEKILEISSNLTAALGDLANSIFEAKMANIDAEIQANDDYYAKQIAAAGTDEKQKELLQAEVEKKRKVLEDKKRKEQHKQAVFNKALSVVQIGISTAMAIMQSYAQLGPIAGSAGAILAAVIGTIQTAAVLAAPIPKYKDGRIGGRKEIAMINDGFENGKYVQEVVERKSGAVEMYSGANRIIQLYDGDNVHKSTDSYNRLQRASTMASINMEGKKMDDFQAQHHFEKSYGKEIVEELKRNTRAVEKQKQTTVQNKIDIPHKLWAYKNINWD